MRSQVGVDDVEWQMRFKFATSDEENNSMDKHFIDNEIFCKDLSLPECLPDRILKLILVSKNYLCPM